METTTEELQAVQAAEPQPTVAVIGSICSAAPIDGADRIHFVMADCAEHGTWSGVVPKDIRCGDTVLVLLQDALLPAGNERWAFMEQRHWRVRMARFKGVPSECVILPCVFGEQDLEPGTDVGQDMGITKYSKPLPAELAGVAKGNFPSFIPKTDEPNFQRVRDWSALLATGEWYASEKADGTSCTAYVTAQDDVVDQLHVCSRNLELLDGDSLYWRMARKYALDRLPVGFALQFEIVGPGVQGNPMGLADNEIRAFTLYNIANRMKCDYLALTDLCIDLSLPQAKLVQLCGLGSNGARTTDELRKMAEIRYDNGRPGEGIVIRALDGGWSLKALNLLYKD